MNTYEVRKIWLADSLSAEEHMKAFKESPVFEFNGLAKVREFINTALIPSYYLGIKCFWAKYGYYTYIVTKKEN